MIISVVTTGIALAEHGDNPSFPNARHQTVSVYENQTFIGTAELHFNQNDFDVTYNTTNHDIIISADKMSIARTQNTDLTTNINCAGGCEVPITGSVKIMDSDFSVNGNGIQCNFDGRVEIYTSVYQVSSVARTNVKLGVSIGGEYDGTVGASGYIRSASGHNESTSNINIITNCSNGDVILVVGFQEGATGHVDQNYINASTLIVKRLS